MENSEEMEGSEEYDGSEEYEGSEELQGTEEPQGTEELQGSEEFVAEGFCEDCLAESTDETPGDVSTVNGCGRQFYGNARPCPKCGSVIKTLWWCMFELPLVPRGSYRYITVSSEGFSSRFWSRRTAMEWGQVLKTWLVGFAIAAAVIGGILIWEACK